MQKVIVIDGKEVNMRASALMPRMYRFKFGRDIISDMVTLKKAYNKLKKLPENATEEEIMEAQLSELDLTIFENASYIMAKLADRNIPDTPDEWIDGFETFSIYEVFPQIIDLWNINQETTSISKKLRETTRESNGAIFMLRCSQLNLSDEALSGMTMGMVYDMITEKANDNEKYPYKATQEDIDAFFGKGD